MPTALELLIDSILWLQFVALIVLGFILQGDAPQQDAAMAAA
jgi:hypothetical protein